MKKWKVLRDTDLGRSVWRWRNLPRGWVIVLGEKGFSTSQTWTLVNGTFYTQHGDKHPTQIERMS